MPGGLNILIVKTVKSPVPGTHHASKAGVYLWGGGVPATGIDSHIKDNEINTNKKSFLKRLRFSTTFNISNRSETP